MDSNICIVSFIPRLLDIGGAETSLQSFVASCPANVKHIIIDTKGIKLTACKHVAIDVNEKLTHVQQSSLLATLKLLKIINHQSNLRILCWMYGPMVVGSIVHYLLRLNDQIIWNVRRSEVPNIFTIPGGIVSRLAFLLSKVVRPRIIFCANAAKKSHLRTGLIGKSVNVVRNGFACSATRTALTKSCSSTGSKQINVSYVGKFDKNKNQKLICEALVYFDNPGIKLKIDFYGRNHEPFRAKNTHLLALLSDKADIEFLGQTKSVDYAKYDLNVLLSKTEGIANTVGEAMGAGVPCLSTDVGDHRILLGSTGWCVSKNISPQTLGKLFTDLARAALMDELFFYKKGAMSKKRIELYFSRERMVQNYLEAII